MGWTSIYTGKSFEKVYQEEIVSSGWNAEFLKHAEIKERYVDNGMVEQSIFYSAVKHPNGYIFGLVTRFARDQDNNVYWKEMDESVDPFYYDMPEDVFELLSPLKEDASDHTKNWRAKVKNKLNIK